MKVKIGSKEYTVGKWYTQRYIHGKPRKLLGVSKPDASWVYWTEDDPSNSKLCTSSQWEIGMGKEL